MHLIVTRPREDAEPLASALTMAGHRVTLAPVSGIVLLPSAPIDLTGVSALAVTSRNALRAIATHPARDALCRLPLYAVGAATAALARRLGFATVVAGAGHARDLRATILAARPSISPDALLHLSGEEIAFDLVAALEAAGCPARRAIVYRMEPARQFPPEAAAALRDGTIDGVLHMSPAAARQFARLLTEAGLRHALAQTTHFCLSAAVAETLAAPVSTIRIAASPSRTEMLALVERFAAEFARKP